MSGSRGGAVGVAGCRLGVERSATRDGGSDSSPPTPVERRHLTPTAGAVSRVTVNKVRRVGEGGDRRQDGPRAQWCIRRPDTMTGRGFHMKKTPPRRTAQVSTYRRKFLVVTDPNRRPRARKGSQSPRRLNPAPFKGRTAQSGPPCIANHPSHPGPSLRALNRGGGIFG